MKRIVCVLLTLIMLLSLVPMGASAASNATSAAAITVLKQMTKFEDECYYFTGSEFRTGYGTVCEEKHSFGTDGKPVAGQDKHTITQAKADTALREVLKKLDEKVNSFATANGKSLTQAQHDALVVFSYDAGTEWMTGNGVLKNVIINNGDTNELLNAMALWTNNTNISRRKVEVNMYKNGIYSNAVPTAYGYVTYDPRGGSMPQQDYDRFFAQYTMHYELAKNIDHPVVPTKAGSIFLGWYLLDGAWTMWAPKLTASHNEQTLTALWQVGTDWQTSPVEVYYSLSKAKLAEYNVYKDGKADKALTEELAKHFENSSSILVDRDFIDANGTRWSRIKSNGGWVKVGTYTGSANNIFVDVMVTVTNSRLNRRVNATIGSAINGSYKQGAQLRIINTAQADGFLWGQVAASATNSTPVGWVALMYTNWSSVKDGDNSGAPVNNGSAIGTATVTFNGYLNLREEPGTDSKIIGALAKNETVEISEIKTVNGHQWGRCKSGWLCLTYTRVLLKENVKISDVGAMAYAFTGKYLGNTNLEVRVEPNANSNVVEYYVPHSTDPKADDVKTELYIAPGTSVTLTNLFVVKDETWAKATWNATAWKWKTEKAEDGKEYSSVTRSGWVKFDDITMNLATFTVAAETVNVREAAGDASKLAFTLNKGVRVEVDEIKLLNENLWGHIHVKLVNHVGVEEAKEGWVNLASKYFSRNGAPTIADTNNTDTGMIATVVNTDSLRVRATGASYGTQIGKLSRGTTVAVWESNDDGWYKVDSNQNGTYDYEGDGWVSGSYVTVRKGTVGGNSTVTDAAGNQFETNGTGKGVVANTYSGVNVRTGPSTGYDAKGKLLPGTMVEILELSGNGKWGRTAQGWVSMDYITMVTYNEVVNTPAGGTTVGSYNDAQKTTTTAVYTGTLAGGVNVYRNPEIKESEIIRTTTQGENITIYELATVTKNVTSDVTDVGDTTTTTTITTTTYWARINDGWVQNPETTITLNALDEKVHTQTGVEKLNVRKGTNTDANDAGDVFDVLVQGDQVNVTALDIIKDKVWGRIDTKEGTGWIRLDYMSEGAVYVQAPVQNSAPTVTQPTIGAGSSTGGFVNNTSGYRYTGNVIRTKELNVRANPSTTASKTTSLKSGQALVIYETTTSEGMAWGRCDAGWVYLYYVDLVPATGAVDARVVANENTIAYTDMNGSAVAGTYTKQSVVDIFEIVGKMARTDLGWVNVDNLL